MSQIQSLTFTNTPTDSSVQTDVRGFGFRPLLIAVAAGSYASNAAFGAGEAAIATYAANQIANSTVNYTFGAGTKDIDAKTQCNIRKQGREVEFSLDITLSSSSTAPVGSDPGELRIVVQPLGEGEPGRYYQFLPPPDVQFGLPVFREVTIQQPTASPVGNWQNVLPNAGASRIMARLLNDGSLALFVNLMNVAPNLNNAIATTDFNGALGQAAGSSPIMIAIKGKYRTA